MALRVELKSYVIVSGFPIEGTVHLDVAQATQDKASQLRVKCRGKLDTKIEDRRAGAAPGTSAVAGPSRRVHRDAIDLIHWDAVLWKASSDTSASASPGSSKTLSIPFSFMSPANLPPDCDLSFVDCSATINYYIEARLERTGMLKLDRKERAPFRCVQPDPIGAQLKPSLPNWDGQWTTLRAEHHVRKVPLFGQKCYTLVEMDMPAVPIIPLWTPIPVRIRIMSMSKKMKRDEWPEDSTKPLFPAPPTQTRELDMKLEITAMIKAGARIRPDNYRTFASSLADLGSKTKSAPLIVLPKVWVPESEALIEEKKALDDSEGRWRQEAQCFTNLRLECPPAFALPTVAIRYDLQLEVPFEGLGNTLKCAVNIIPVSGLMGPDESVDRYSQPPPEEPQLPPYPSANIDT